jgi:carbonic anhydrase
MARASTDRPVAIGRRTMLRWGSVAAAGSLVAGCAKNTGGNAQDAATAGASATEQPAISTAAGALARLKEGNARFAASAVTHPDESTSRRTTLAGGQHPFALIFSCVDSRVPPELVFDQGLGDLFVSRTAGQVLDHAVMGSIQYGVAELKIPLVVVMGHEKCGAVKATVEAVEKSTAPSGNDIDTLVAAIRPAVEEAVTEHATDVLEAAVRYNVGNVVAKLTADNVLRSAVSAGKLRIVGARYGLSDGRVTFL